MINKENLEKWVAALESGEYKKLKGRMGDDEQTACVTGVGILVYLKENGLLPELKEQMDGFRLQGVRPWSAIRLHIRNATRWYGLDEALYTLGTLPVPLPEPFKGHDRMAVMAANDLTDMTFPDLAQAIRKEYL